MKKTLLSSILLFSVLATAQNKTTINTIPAEPVHSFKKVNVSSFRKTNPLFTNKTASSPGSAWFNQLDYLELLLPGTAVFSAMSVFPDSAIILGYDGTGAIVNPWIHKAANYMDPSFMAQQTFINDKLATYFIDSVSVGYIYERNTGLADNTADSLIIQVIAENPLLNYALTTFSYQDIEFNFLTQNIRTTTPLLKRLSIALTYADTSSGGVYKQIKVATPGIAAQTNSKKIGTVITFKPGYTYTPSDILIGDGTNIANKNLFMILSAEQNGVGTDPTYFGTLADYTSDMNMSFILDQSVRYDMNTNGWNGYFLPTYAFVTSFRYESHDIGYKLTVPVVTGVKDLQNNGFALGQNSPNPFTKESTVRFDLAKDVNSATFTITDITGRIISSEKVSTTKGSHSIKLGVFAAGLYYYSLNVDGNATTKKMIVE